MPRPISRRPIAIARLARLVVACVLVSLLLAACAPFGPDGPAPPRRLDDAHQVLRPLLAGVATLDPALIQFGADYDIAQAIFPPLVTLDAKLDVIPWATTAPPDVSADGLTYTFHLHPGMRWSDGVPIDAGAYAYAINRSLDTCTNPYFEAWNHLANIKGAAAFRKPPCPLGATSHPASLNLTDGPARSVVVADPLTLKVTLESPAASFLAAFTYSGFWAQPRQLIDRYGDKWTDHLADGAGFGGNPFKVTRWEHAGTFPLRIGRLTLARNDAFWGQKPALRAVDYTLNPSAATLWGDFTSGAGDVGYPPVADLAAAKQLPGYREIPELVVRYLHLNWAQAPFDDLRVRRAFDLAFDRTALCALALNGACLPTYHMLIKGLPGYDEGLKDPAGRTGAAALAADVAAARRLAQAYADEKCGGEYAGCPPIALVVGNGNDAETARGQFFRDAWQAAFPGWKISVVSYHGCPEAGCGPFQIFTDGWGADYPDPQDLLTLQVRTGADNNDGDYGGHVSITEADALLDRADAEPDRATRLALYQRAEQLYVDRVAWIPWGQAKGVVVVRPRVVGWAYAPSLTVPLPAWQSA